MNTTNVGCLVDRDNRRPILRLLRKHWIMYVLFYAVFLNIPFWLAARSQGLLLHGWICIEYALIGIVALLIPRKAIPALILITIAIDIVSAVCETYFLLPSQLFKNIAGIVDFSPVRLFFAVVTTLLAIILAASTSFVQLGAGTRKERIKAATLLLLFAIGCVSGDYFDGLAGTGQNPNLVRGFNTADTLNLRHYVHTRFSRLPVRWLASRTAFDEQLDHEIFNSRSEPSRTSNAINEVLKAQGITLLSPQKDLPNIVLIVVESWGETNDSLIRGAITSPYRAEGVLADYKRLEGAVPFYGATIDGEARELCGTTVGLHIIEATAKELVACLPDRLSSLGYDTTGIHGMDGHWFDRRAWYQTIGFHEVFFRNQLTALGLNRCAGAFIGICDSEIAKWITERLASRRDKPQFIYWMTLNSHLPVPYPPPLATPTSCAISAQLSESAALCSWFQLEANVHQSVASAAIATAHYRPTIFVMVGDHAPPFSSPPLRASFSQSLVPYIALIPKVFQSHLPDDKWMQTLPTESTGMSQ